MKTGQVKLEGSSHTLLQVVDLASKSSQYDFPLLKSAFTLYLGPLRYILLFKQAFPFYRRTTQRNRNSLNAGDGNGLKDESANENEQVD